MIPYNLCLDIRTAPNRLYSSLPFVNAGFAIEPGRISQNSNNGEHQSYAGHKINQQPNTAEDTTTTLLEEPMYYGTLPKSKLFLRLSQCEFLQQIFEQARVFAK